jgi:hypothetical protein
VGDAGGLKKLMREFLRQNRKEYDMANEDEAALKSTAKDKATDARVKELRAELEHLGRFGIVSWTDDDLIDALENAGAAPTAKNIAAVREYLENIADEMTATGWRVIQAAIDHLDLSRRVVTDKEIE